MKIFNRKCFVVLLTAAIGVTGLTGCSSKLDGSAVVATVGKEKIPLSMANFLAKEQQAQYETYYKSYYGEEMWSKDMGDGKSLTDMVKSSSMESLQQMYILAEHAEEYQIQLTEEDKKAIDKAADEFMKQNKEKAVTAMTASKETVSKILELYTIQFRMNEAMTADVDTNVSDDEAAQKAVSYVLVNTGAVTDKDGNQVELTEEQKAEKKTLAQTMLDKANTNGDLEAAAKEQELTVTDAYYGADTTSLDSEIMTLADTLEEGKLGMAETDKGIYIVKLNSNFDREATDKKKTEIVSKRKQDKFKEIYDGWKKDTDFKIEEKVWKTVDFKKSLVLKTEEQTQK